MLNKFMFEDRMYLKTRFTGKDLQRAIHKHGIYKARMAEADRIKKEQEDRILEMISKFKLD